MAVRTLLPIVTALLACSCVTLGRYEQLEARVTKLEMEREKLLATMSEDMKRLENLHEMLKQAEQTLRKSGVNLGIRVERLEQDVPKLDGDLDVVRHQTDQVTKLLDRVKRELADRLGSYRLYLPGKLPAEPEAIWTAAVEAAKAGRPLEARALYEYLETTHHDDERADDAVMGIAALQEADGDLDGAIKTYMSIESGFPEGDQVTKAIMRIGELLETKGECEKAKGIYEYLSKQYKDSEEGKEAAKRERKVLRECKPAG